MVNFKLASECDPPVRKNILRSQFLSDNFCREKHNNSKRPAVWFDRDQYFERVIKCRKKSANNCELI